MENKSKVALVIAAGAGVTGIILATRGAKAAPPPPGKGAVIFNITPSNMAATTIIAIDGEGINGLTANLLPGEHGWEAIAIDNEQLAGTVLIVEGQTKTVDLVFNPVIPPPGTAFEYSNFQVSLQPSWDGSSWLTAIVHVQVKNISNQAMSHVLHCWQTLGGGGATDMSVNLSNTIWAKTVVLQPGDWQDLTFGPGSGQVVFSPSEPGTLWVQDELGNKSPVFTK